MKKSFLLFIFSITVLACTAQLSEKVGIGVRLQIDSARGYKTPLVIALVPNGAAGDAGLQEGDLIVNVDGRSTRDVALDEVVKMIVGDEGTAVNVEIERKGVKRNYTIVRKKYKYAGSYYQPAVRDNDFCSSLARLMNDAPYDFEHTMDTTRYVDEKKAFGSRIYESRVRVPGAEKVSMQSAFGMSCVVNFGTFASTDEVNKAGENLVNRIKTCFPDYYYKPVLETKGSNSVEIGQVFPTGFESAIIQLFSIQSETDQSYNLTLRINGGKATRYYEIKTEAPDNSFAKALRTIYDDILKNYNTVKGTKHEEKGTGLFSMSSSWYEVNPVPDGAHDCSISEGGLSLANGCKCRFYSGANRDNAAEAYKKLFDLTRDALGSAFVYSLEKPMLDMTIPGDAESVVTFGIKKRHTYESLPLLALVLFKDAENHYSVNMLFHKFGF